jgi:hypothetical protein
MDLGFPQAADPSQKVYQYAAGGGSLPFQIGIDLRTMKIVGTRDSTTSKSYIEELAGKTLD